MAHLLTFGEGWWWKPFPTLVPTWCRSELGPAAEFGCESSKIKFAKFQFILVLCHSLSGARVKGGSTIYTPILVSFISSSFHFISFLVAFISFIHSFISASFIFRFIILTSPFLGREQLLCFPSSFQRMFHFNSWIKAPQYNECWQGTMKSFHPGCHLSPSFQ